MGGGANRHMGGAVLNGAVAHRYHVGRGAYRYHPGGIVSQWEEDFHVLTCLWIKQGFDLALGGQYGRYRLPCSRHANQTPSRPEPLQGKHELLLQQLMLV